MSHSHAHSPVADREPLTPEQRRRLRSGRRRAATMLAAVLLPVLAATVVGLVVLWPDGSKPRASLDFAAGGVTFPRGTVTALTTAPCATGGVEGAPALPQPKT